jgi:hypothetical protein
VALIAAGFQDNQASRESLLMNKHRVFLAWALACGLGAQPAFAADNPPADKAGAAVEAVPPRPAADAAGNPMDSVIGGVSAFDRTRPFMPGEKLVYFVNIKDGDKLKSPFRVAFVVSGMGISPVKAGKQEGTGHHHILIDAPMPADIKTPIPFDKPGEYRNQHYKHFGGGETETVLDLPEGKHTLRLLFADHQHVPYYIASNQITIEVISAAPHPEEQNKAATAKK